jgi:hypothetical protein
MSDLASHVDGCTIFSKLDLRKGYLQVLVAMIITPFSLLEFVCMRFGLCNANMTFHHLMDSLLGGLHIAIVYLEDILAASPDPAAHHQQLAAVFSILQQNGQFRKVHLW